MFCLPVCDGAMSKLEQIFIWQRGCAAALPRRSATERAEMDSLKSCQATEEFSASVPNQRQSKNKMKSQRYKCSIPNHFFESI